MKKQFQKFQKELFLHLESFSLIGDLFTGYGGISRGMYLWPLTRRWVELKIAIDMRSIFCYVIELFLFGLMILSFFYKKGIAERARV